MLSESAPISPLRAALWLACACLLASSSGCAASGEVSGQQQQVPQTRARRVTTESPEGANTERGTTPTKMPETNAEKKEKSSPFYAALDVALQARKTRIESLCDMNDSVERRVLEDYGAMFLSARTVLPPPVCVFTSEDEVLDFQEEADFTTAVVGGDEIELQPAAMKSLLAARAEARALRLDITPRGGAEAARRSYRDTLRLWNTRFLPALSYWGKRGRLSKEQVTRLKQLPLREQVREVLELEEDGIYFSKDFSKSILYSIAAPGTSQHLAMLALDVEQFADERVRRILARHGWFQTVKSDLPHFTYLGLEEKELPARGLRPVVSGKQLFWIPNVGE
ncbi:MAG TPA: hypothetical protein VN256_15790 [Pyrinomonadaceae bacterium]|nr:hypothetical protein [Pyrinomonadaceae bacterium]